MNKTSVILFILAVLSCIASAKDVRVEGDSVTFVVPDDFTNLSQEEINVKYPRSNPPRYVVGNEGRATTIAYQLHPQPMKESDLPDAQKAFTQALDQGIPGIEWKQNAVADLLGQKWIIMEMTSRAVDQDIHNIIMITLHRGRMLMFNFNTTKRDFPQTEKLLRTSIKSIKLKP